MAIESIGRFGRSVIAPRISLIDRKMGFGTPGAVCFNHENGLPTAGGGSPIAGRFNKLSIGNLGDISGKRILVRVDFNVSDPGTGKIKSDARLKAALATIAELRARGAKVILLSHNDDPHKVAKSAGKELDVVMQTLTLRPIAEKLTKLLREEGEFKNGESVAFVDKVFGSEVAGAVACMRDRDILLLENSRMDERDVKGDLSLAEEIINTVLPHAFVLDGFSVMHRDQSTVTGMAKLMKGKGKPVVAGRLVEKEIDVFGKMILENPNHPYVVFAGGAKVKDKIKIMKNLITKVDKLVVGGAMVWAFLRAKGYKDVGEDPLARKEAEEQEGDIRLAQEILGSSQGKIIVPTALTAYNEEGDIIYVDLKRNETVPAGYRIGDIPADEISLIFEQLGVIRTAVWNGNFGYTDHKKDELASVLSEGSMTLLDFLADAASDGWVVAAGGGDTEKVIKVYMKQNGIKELPITHLSTGGGSMTDLLANGGLPGFDVIDNLI